MPKVMRVFVLFAFQFLCAPGLWSQEPRTASDKPMAYENHNQTDYSALTLRTVGGMARDEQGVPTPEVLFGLFTDKDHRLMATVRSASDGTFRFRDVAPGPYRLVVKYDGFCSANIPISVSRHASLKEDVDVHMKPAGLDSCSYGTLGRTP